MVNIIVFLALASAPGLELDPDDPAPARVIVRLPADAKLYVDGMLCSLTSDVRSFNTPALRPGKKYYYTLKAEAIRDGRTISAKKKITLRAGKTTEVDFSKLGRDIADPEVDPARLPQGPEPMQALAKIGQGGDLLLSYRVHKQVTEKRTGTRTVEGRPETYAYDVVRSVFETVPITAKAEHVQVFDTNGRVIDSENLPELLEKETAILFTYGQKPDPSYLKIYKEGTIILVLTQVRPPVLPMPAVPTPRSPQGPPPATPIPAAPKAPATPVFPPPATSAPAVPKESPSTAPAPKAPKASPPAPASTATEG